MSLPIEVDNVSAILLADGWHAVDRLGRGSGRTISTFTIGAFRFTEDDRPVVVDPVSDAFVGGFSFIENGETFAGPWTSIIAVRYRDDRAG